MHTIPAECIAIRDYCGDTLGDGNDFYKDVLLTKYNDAKYTRKVLLVYLDGVFGYPPSFIMQTFGRLAIEEAKEGRDILKVIIFISKSKDTKEYITKLIDQAKRIG